MAQRRAMSRNRDEGTPLRSSAGTGELDEAQERLLGAFLVSCIIGGVGVYVTKYAASGAIKLKLYNDGEQYTDVLNVSEDWKPLFDDYAKQVGVQAHYRAIAAPLAARGSLSGTESDENGPEVPLSPGRPLRAS